MRFFATDLRDDESCEACVADAVAAYGSVDFLINLACVYVDEGSDSTREDWLESYNVNVVGGVMILKAAREHLRRAGGGAVVNFGSISAKVAQTGRWLYPVSKAAILQLTRTARRWISPPMGSVSIRSHPAGPGRGS